MLWLRRPPRSWPLHTKGLLVAALLLTLLVPTANGALRTEVGPVESVSLGWADVVPQSQANSCGPALLATMLKRDGVEVSEAQLIAAANMGPGGVSLAEFSRLAASHGLEGEWLQSLNRSIRTLSTPAVLHTNSGSGHFILIEQLAGSYAVVTDPAAGRELRPVAKIEEQWPGYFFRFENVRRTGNPPRRG